MKISIVTVCYNAVSVIENTILSVINQTYPDIEYIIIDGGSTDGTVEIIEKYSDRLAYWVSEPDNGIYDAMNKGIKVVTGDYINFMNAGDTFINTEIIASVALYIELNPDKKIYYGDSTYLYPYGKIIVPALPIDTIKDRLPYCHQSSFVDAKLAKEKPFNCSFRYCADYKFAYDVIGANKQNALHIPVNIVVYEASDGISSRMLKSTFREMYRIKGIKPYSTRYLTSEISLLMICFRNFIRKNLPHKIAKQFQQWRIQKRQY
ncbi:glycosyltransferase family 2 protein [Duncaniella freteri]|uniref:glycosyltransferase family 2 protein n=2 Tax=Duncaniella TaxID=2518495 RepID=UPI00255749AF|nr:glycosyltransferase family 2 protein [Duncaniella freteri]